MSPIIEQLKSRLRYFPTSGYKGVFYRPKTEKYEATVTARGKPHYVGVFDTAEDADRAAHAKRKELHGEFACGM